MGEQQRVGTGGAQRGARALAVIAVVSSMLMASSAARAQHVTHASLAYERTAEASACPDEDEFREVVAERLGRDPFVADTVTVVRVLFERDGRDYVGTVRVTDSAGDRAATRTLRARSCESVATSLATVIAVGLEPPPTAPDTSIAVDPAAAVPEVESDAAALDEDPMHVPEVAPVAVASASTSVQVVVVPPASEERPPRRRRALIVAGVLMIAGVILAVGLSRNARTDYADYTPTDVSVAALRFGP